MPTPSTITAIMTPKLAADGCVAGVESLRYSIDGAAETHLLNTRFQGPCTALWFWRTAIPPGGPGNTEAIGDLIQTFPATEENGSIRENIQIYPAS
jgi:hypothetical protein